tara:strand:- start:53 stop:364 length:312 start_codon:yes stop_codon:yes gene_type:complete
MPRHNRVTTPIPNRKGKWVEERVPYTPEEEAFADQEKQEWADGADARTMDAIRQKRDQLISATDWWGASDNTMSDAQTAYRLALRNYPATYTADNSAAWPTKP